MNRVITLFAALAATLMAGAQPTLVKVNRQQAFDQTIPAGNYSGLTRVGENEYAVVSDKGNDGFYIFQIDIDPTTGVITSAKRSQSHINNAKGRDAEDIAFCPDSHTLFIAGESDNQVLEYDRHGQPTGRRLDMPKAFLAAGRKYGIEALTYNAHTRTFWLTSESTLKNDGQQANAENKVQNRLRLQAFNSQLAPTAQYFYLMDAPVAKKKAATYAMGCSAITALDDGRLLVLEREFYVPQAKLGAFVNCKIYVVAPQKGDAVNMNAAWDNRRVLAKTLLCEWKTHLGLFDQSIANYEGMCLGPKLDNGDQVVILIADSQNQYGGVLSDWLRTIVIRCQ